MNTGIIQHARTVRLLLWMVVSLSLLFIGPFPTSAGRKADVSPQILFGRGQFEQASLAYTLDIQHHPDRMPARLGLVRTLLRLDRWPEALGVAQTAARLAPGSADAQALYALAALRAGDPETAAPAATRALALDWNSYWALISDGQLALWDGRDAKALRDFRRATALRPSDPDGWLGLLLSVNRTEEGRKAAVAYLRLAPQGHPHDRAVKVVRNLLENWPTLRRAYGSDSFFQAVAPVPEVALQAWRRSGASLSVTVPLQHKQSYWLIPVQINGQTFHLIFDTGAGNGITLNPKAAQRLHLSPLAQSLVSSIQGNAESTDLYAKTMTIGGLTFSSIPINVVRQPMDSSDGLFGAAVLDKYRVTLDLEKCLMTLERGRAANRRPSPEEAAVPFHLYRDDILTRVRVEGNGPGRCWIQGPMAISFPCATRGIWQRAPPR